MTNYSLERSLMDLIGTLWRLNLGEDNINSLDFQYMLERKYHNG